jgi:2-keto-4-pentenoate hydratase
MNDDVVPAAALPPAVIEPPWTTAELIERLVAARRGGPRVTAERVASAVKSIDDAYRVQASVGAALWPTAEATVWKAGADSRDSLPTAAPIAPDLVYANGAALPTAAFPVRIVEAEIAYRFGVDLPPRATPYSTDEVADAVASMHAAIEVVSPRIADFETASSVAKLADHLVNGAFVLGDGVDAWRKIDLRKQKGALSLGKRVHEAVRGSHALGNPAVLLPWFVAHLGRLPTFDADGRPGPPRGVRAGDVVTTGSWTKVVEAKAKQRVEASFEGIGSAVLSFD